MYDVVTSMFSLHLSRRSRQSVLNLCRRNAIPVAVFGRLGRMDQARRQKEQEGLQQRRARVMFRSDHSHLW